MKKISVSLTSLVICFGLSGCLETSPSGSPNVLQPQENLSGNYRGIYAPVEPVSAANAQDVAEYYPSQVIVGCVDERDNSQVDLSLCLNGQAASVFVPNPAAFCQSAGFKLSGTNNPLDEYGNYLGSSPSTLQNQISIIPLSQFSGMQNPGVYNSLNNNYWTIGASRSEFTESTSGVTNIPDQASMITFLGTDSGYQQLLSGLGQVLTPVDRSFVSYNINVLMNGDLNYSNSQLFLALNPLVFSIGQAPEASGQQYTSTQSIDGIDGLNMVMGECDYIVMTDTNNNQYIVMYGQQ